MGSKILAGVQVAWLDISYSIRGIAGDFSTIWREMRVGKVAMLFVRRKWVPPL